MATYDNRPTVTDLPPFPSGVVFTGILLLTIGILGYAWISGLHLEGAGPNLKASRPVESAEAIAAQNAAIVGKQGPYRGPAEAPIVPTAEPERFFRPEIVKFSDGTVLHCVYWRHPEFSAEFHCVK